MSGHSTDAIREAFLSFFEAHDHQRVDSSPLVPQNDPTLLFTNAGMVQFKDVFTGKETRNYTRACSAQKCVRAGGKHNDLENVGFTPRHHTFFEMLGNFSFGDYFKEEAIALAWRFVTETLGLSKDRLAVTVFAGDDEIPADDEAARLWEAVGVPADRIYRLGRKDNYWQMGDTGPQGPCSEIHFYPLDPDPSMWSQARVAESDGWLEIWNLVFMQFERAEVDAPLVPLPKPCVDTGAGLERLAMVLQGKSSTYDTDLFAGLMADVSALCPEGSAPAETSLRVIADHARATAFLVADGVQPANEGRGYVLRRIMRRAIRHGKLIGMEELFLHRACAAVVTRMAHAYPDLARGAALIEKVATNEETSFRRTLTRGLDLLDAELDRSRTLEPEFVAKLYDTYGFPIDLTRVIAAEHGVSVDEERAQDVVRAMQAAGAGKELSTDKSVEGVWFKVQEREGATRFLGYEASDGKGRVVAIVDEGAELSSVGPGRRAWVVLEQTPFYGESGGQIGDEGTLTGSWGHARVVDTQKPVPSLIAHRVEIGAGQLEVGNDVEAAVDFERRVDVMRNHSATHLLHLALREVLGDHVQQKGSLVAPDRLRFDFSNFEPITREQLVRIEDRVNAMVLANAPTQVRVDTIDAAKEAGALMLFGEKYGDTVRMVRIGDDSLELCGGTHVERAGDIGAFKILQESAVASGVRRIEATTGRWALEWSRTQERLVLEAAAALKTSPEQLPERIEKLVKRTRELERELEQTRTQIALGAPASSEREEDINGVRFVFKQADGTPKKALRSLADRLRDKLGSGVVVVTSAEGDKGSLLVAATKDLDARVHAGNLVRAALSSVEGSGGGRADFAQGGAPADRLAEAVEKVRELASRPE